MKFKENHFYGFIIDLSSVPDQLIIHRYAVWKNVNARSLNNPRRKMFEIPRQSWEEKIRFTQTASYIHKDH